MTLIFLLAVLAMAALVGVFVFAEISRSRAPRNVLGPGDRVDDSIDLHGFAPRDIPSAVEAYLQAAVRSGLAEVRVIHGKGKGVQRQRVQQVLARSPRVEEFQDAPPGRGSWGATLVRLRLEQDPAGDPHTRR